MGEIPEGLMEGLAAPGGGMAPTINQGLERGSVEAARTAYENSLKGDQKEEEMDEERNDLLGIIAENTGQVQMGLA